MTRLPASAAATAAQAPAGPPPTTSTSVETSSASATRRGLITRQLLLALTIQAPPQPWSSRCAPIRVLPALSAMGLDEAARGHDRRAAEEMARVTGNANQGRDQP